jgi:hypothetical protein
MIYLFKVSIIWAKDKDPNLGKQPTSFRVEGEM